MNGDERVEERGTTGGRARLLMETKDLVILKRFDGTPTTCETRTVSWEICKALVGELKENLFNK